MAINLDYKAAAYMAGNEDFSAVTAPRFVKLDSTGRAVTATYGSPCEGILVNHPPIANVLSVAYGGVCDMQVAGTYPIGTFLQAGVNGIGFIDSTRDAFTRAVMLEGSDSTNDIVTVRLLDR